MKFLLFVQQEELGDTVEDHTTDYIQKQAQIYGTKSDKEITPYQKRINEAATEIALQSPDLLSSRQKLLELVRIKVNESGYMYKKGKSRSKQFISDESLSSTPKRLKVGEAMRVKRMAELGDDRVYFKEKRREHASASQNYKLCDQLTEEISAIKCERRERELELNSWKKKQQKAHWYKKTRMNELSSTRKRMLSCSSDESEGSTFIQNCLPIPCSRSSFSPTSDTSKLPSLNSTSPPLSDTSSLFVSRSPTPSCLIINSPSLQSPSPSALDVYTPSPQEIPPSSSNVNVNSSSLRASSPIDPSAQPSTSSTLLRVLYSHLFLLFLLLTIQLSNHHPFLRKKKGLPLFSKAFSL